MEDFPSLPARRSRAPMIAAAALIALFAGLLLGLPESNLRLAVSDFGLAVGALLAGVATFVRGRRSAGRVRSAWLMMAGASFAWALGEIAWSWYEVVLGVEVPVPSIADAGYLGAIPLAAAGVLFFPGVPRNRSACVRILLDGLVVGCSLLLLSWVVALRSLAAGGEPLIPTLIGVAYPVGDVIILSVVASAFLRCMGDGRRRLGLVGAGLIAIALADTGYVVETLQDTFASGGLLDVLWFSGYILLGLAATQPASWDPAQHAQAFTKTSAVIPYLAVIAASGIMVTEKLSKGRVDLVTYMLVFGVVALVGLRQLLTQIENVMLNRTLEHRVGIRTRELTSALEEVRAAGRLQENFIASTSHELRTPLTAIIGANKTMMRAMPDAPEIVRELSEIVDRNALRMAKLVEDLLAMSGVTSSDHQSDTLMDATAILEQVTEPIREQDANVISWTTEPVVAFGRPHGVRVIVEQLLSNAVKFGRGAPIHVSARSVVGGAVITVHDEGPGVPEEMRERIFDRFFQVDGGSTRANGGLGLGLHLARQTAEAMGGALVVEPSAAGATFSLRLRSDVPVRALASANAG